MKAKLANGISAIATCALAALCLLLMGNDGCSEFADELDDPCPVGEDECYSTCIPEGADCCGPTPTGSEYCDPGSICVPNGCQREGQTPGTGGGGGSCLDAGEPCQSNGECCSGSACVIDDDGGALCSDYCSVNSDCVSDCCAPLTNGNAVCSSPVYCQ